MKWLFAEPWIGPRLKLALRSAYPTILRLYQYYCGLNRHLYLTVILTLMLILTLTLTLTGRARSII